MDRASFRALLQDAVLPADGGMGTSLIDRGVSVDACIEETNLLAPALVRAVHAGFVEAGARLVLTNTFGANRHRLERHGLADRVGELCDVGVRLAREAGAELVGGSMGPLGVRLQPYGRVRPDDVFDAYREQAAALARAGADVLAVETQTDLRELEQAVAAAREAAPDLPLLATATFTRDDRTVLGSSPGDVARRLVALEVDALGVNCGEGPAQVLRVLEAMRPFAGGVPLIARPNAGGPSSVGGRFVYPATAEYVGELTGAYVDAGARVVGGCCGTGPAHTASIVAAVRAYAPSPHLSFTGEHREVEPAAPVREPTALAAALGDAAAGRGLVVAVEMEPPRSFDASTLVAAAETLREAGATAIDVADSPMAKMRMSAWAACRLIEEQAAIETVLHFPTRGRNLLRLQGDLLGAHALGIRNLFVCVGDPVTVGDYPQSLNDVDLTATGVLRLITQRFNTGVDRAGSPIGGPTAFVPGAAVAPSAPDLEREVRLLHRKVEAGARFLLSQPLYAADPLRSLRETYERVAGEPLEVPILAGVLPLVSARHAEFLHNEVPGIDIPGAARTRMHAAGEGEPAWREGLAMATDLIGALRAEGVAGIYVMPQFGRYDRAADVVEAARRG
jgi:methionine synthase I (cobalamin-dependent)/5,10-methylenetetrahydrofolate reductase